MKKLFLILALIDSFSLEAQFVTTFAKNVPESQEDGMFYYLPRNIIKIEFTVEQTDYYIGPYAEFASKMMSNLDVIKETKTDYVIKNVDIQMACNADPNAVYFVSSDEKSKDPLPSLILDSDGVILALGYDSIPSKSRINRNQFTYTESETPVKQSITFIEVLDNDIEIDDDDDDDKKGSSAPKITKEDKAKAAVEKIANIRNAYLELVSGSNEVAFGNSTSYMAESLQNLENEYISLFKGKSVKNVYKKVYYFTPEKNNLNASVSIAKLSYTDGLVDMSGRGEVIKIQFEGKNSLANIKAMSNDTKTSSQINKIFYRIPAETNVKIMLGNNVLTEKLLSINQFGDVRAVSVKNNKILFNPNTGQIISILK